MDKPIELIFFFYNRIFIKYPRDNYFKLFNIYNIKVKEYLICLD